MGILAPSRDLIDSEYSQVTYNMEEEVLKKWEKTTSSNCKKIINYIVDTIETETYDTAIVGDLIVNSHEIWYFWVMNKNGVVY